MENQQKRRGKIPSKQTMKLYNHLLNLDEKGEFRTGWKSMEDICRFLFDDTLTFKTLERTKIIVISVRGMLRLYDGKFFYSTNSDGYVLAKNERHFLEIMKRQIATLIGSGKAWQHIYTEAVKKFPSLKNQFTQEIKLLKTGDYEPRIPSHKKDTTRPKSTA